MTNEQRHKWKRELTNALNLRNRDRVRELLSGATALELIGMIHWRGEIDIEYAKRVLEDHK